jgi:hypothetical protein
MIQKDFFQIVCPTIIIYFAIIRILFAKLIFNKYF